MLAESGYLLRIFIGEHDKKGDLPLYKWLFQTAKEKGIATVTVLHAIEGFGATSRVHIGSLLRLSTDLPVVIEMIDNTTKIEEFLSIIDPCMESGLVTLEKATIHFYSVR